MSFLLSRIASWLLQWLAFPWLLCIWWSLWFTLKCLDLFWLFRSRPWCGRTWEWANRVCWICCCSLKQLMVPWDSRYYFCVSTIPSFSCYYSQFLHWVYRNLVQAQSWECCRVYWFIATDSGFRRWLRQISSSSYSWNCFRLFHSFLLPFLTSAECYSVFWNQIEYLMIGQFICQVATMDLFWQIELAHFTEEFESVSLAPLTCEASWQSRHRHPFCWQ